MATKKTATKKASTPKKKAAEPKPKMSGVRLDPANVTLIPGNTPSFIADAPEGRLMVKITAQNGTWMVSPSVNGGLARVSKILEVPGDITVEFFADGKKYAEGSWTI